MPYDWRSVSAPSCFSPRSRLQVWRTPALKGEDENDPNDSSVNSSRFARTSVSGSLVLSMTTSVNLCTGSSTDSRRPVEWLTRIQKFIWS